MRFLCGFAVVNTSSKVCSECNDLGPIAQLVRAEDLRVISLKHCKMSWFITNGLHMSKFTLLVCRTTQIRGSLCVIAW